MLLPVLTITAILIGCISFVVIPVTRSDKSRKSVQPSISPHQQVSLYSLVLFLFFPTRSVPSKTKEFG